MILSLPVTGVFNTNAYFYIDDATGHGFLLDPGAEADTLLAVIRQRGFVIEKILFTHGHFDHMGAAAQIQDALSIPICMHERGREYTENSRWNLSKGCGLTHFPGGDEQTLMQSITQRILKLSQETVLLSGHTEPTTVGAERERSWYALFLN